MSVLTDLDELISRDDEASDYCSETGPNEAMRRCVELTAIRAAVAELIEAKKRADAWDAAFAELSEHVKRNKDRRWVLSCLDGLRAQYEALARVKGGAS